MKFKPRYDRVLVEPHSMDVTLESGLIVPATAEREKPISGVVVAVGEGYTTESGSFVEVKAKVGSTVLFGAYAGVEVEIDKKPYLVLRDRDLLLEGDDADG